MKYIQTDYTNPRKQILKFPDHYVGVAVMIDDTGVVANLDGKKIVPAGTILGTAGANPILSDPTMKAKNVNNDTDAAKAEGVLYYDVDVTYGPAPGTMIIHGFINENNLPEAPKADAVNALKGRIVFLK